MSLTVDAPEKGQFTLSITVHGDHPRSDVTGDVAAAIGGAHNPTVQVWVEDAAETDTALLQPLGLTPYRDLLQLRCPLPAAPSGLTTRAFVPGPDNEAFITVNNRAFSWHPEQSGLTNEAFERTMTEPWFDADGFRLLEIDDALAGFCWTKVHADHDPVLGEIYVIAVDPAFHGQGLGAPMTLAGLEHLSAKGITTSNLYVEADNVAALRVYERIGYHVHSTNRAFSA